jgi:hypothetical protein
MAYRYDLQTANQVRFGIGMCTSWKLLTRTRVSLDGFMLISLRDKEKEGEPHITQFVAQGGQMMMTLQET